MIENDFWSLQVKVAFLEDRVKKHDRLLLEIVDKLRSYANEGVGSGKSDQLLLLMGEITGMILRSGVKV